MAPVKRLVPKVGLLINSIDVFNPEAKNQSEQSLRNYFQELIDSGVIASDSLVRGRLFHIHDANKAADDFAAACVDLVVIANIAFPNGHVFTTVATHPHLYKVPLALIAEPEYESDDWTMNAWCGVIMNNYVAKQIGRPIAAIPGRFDSPEFRTAFERLVKVTATIKFLRNDLLGRFGEAPGGFHCASGNQLAFLSTFGTKVDTVDESAVAHTAKTGKAKGYLGEVTFTEDDVKKTAEEMKAGCKVTATDEMVEHAARQYHAFKAIIEANGFTSAAIRCWPEYQSEILGGALCATMGLLLANGVVTAASCESDWPTTVAQTMSTLLSGRPAACLDWVNYTGGSDIIQLGHCGVGIPGQMAGKSACGCGCNGTCEALDIHPVARQAGVTTVGPAHVGQYEYGKKTGVALMQGADGRFKLLVFTGENTPETDKKMRYSAADIKVEDYKELNRLILDYGFPHHLAMAFGDISEELKMLCEFLDVDFLTPHK